MTLFIYFLGVTFFAVGIGIISQGIAYPLLILGAGYIVVATLKWMESD